MMGRLVTVLVAASTLGACTSLGGCGGSGKPVAPRSGEVSRTLSRDQVLQVSQQEFVGRADWFAVDLYRNGMQVVLVSTPKEGVDSRLLTFLPDRGYQVSRIRVSCPYGGYSVRDARSSDTDAGSPRTVSKGDPGLPITQRLSQICSRTAKLPTFAGALDVAVRKGRAMNAALASRAATAPAAGDVAKVLKDDRPKSQVFRVDASGHVVQTGAPASTSTPGAVRPRP